MRYLLIALFVFGCGTAPEQDKKPAPSGDPSATKLRMGLATADVSRILGSPISIETGNEWRYDGEHCSPASTGYPKGTCTVSFGLLDNLLFSMDGIAPAYVDLTR